MKRFLSLYCAFLALITTCSASQVPTITDCILHLSVANSDLGSTERIIWFGPDGISYVLFDGTGTTINGERKLSLSLSPYTAGTYSFTAGDSLGFSTISSAAIIPWKSSTVQQFTYSLSAPNLWNHGGISMVTAVDIDWGHSTEGAINSSNNSYLLPGKPSTAGFVLSGQPRWVLVRAITKSLQPYGITSNVSSMTMKIFDAKGTIVGNGVSWCSSDEYTKLFTALFKRVAAFQLSPGSNEPVFLAQLPEGAYTVQVSTNDVSGEVLTEIYLMPYSTGSL